MTFRHVFPLTYKHVSKDENETKLLTSLLFFEMNQKNTWVHGVEWDFVMSGEGNTIGTFYIRYLEKDFLHLELMLARLNMYSTDLITSLRDQWLG